MERKGVPRQAPDGTYLIAEQMPLLEGGLKQLQHEIAYPTLARKAGIEGRVIVQFIVDETGRVTAPHIVRGIGGGCDEEALRVVRRARFQPGMVDGRPVPVKMSLPITFRLDGSATDTFDAFGAAEQAPPPPTSAPSQRDAYHDNGAPPQPTSAASTLRLPEGATSIRVIADGEPLEEGSDYTVDHARGTVTITNPAFLGSDRVISLKVDD